MHIYIYARKIIYANHNQLLHLRYFIF
uniref:Uncharacterized protein n=1 Tax=Anguilla anguilla TaxID=7936 RepID=A0A0E9P5U2_ANGAN